MVRSFGRNVWSNPEPTCQHVDAETAVKASGRASLELKSLLFQGALDDRLPGD